MENEQKGDPTTEGRLLDDEIRYFSLRIRRAMCYKLGRFSSVYLTRVIDEKSIFLISRREVAA